MRDLPKPVADLIRGTAIASDEVELARLSNFPLKEQLEIGIVLYEAMLQEKRPDNGGSNPTLAGLRSVTDARAFLVRSRDSTP